MSLSNANSVIAIIATAAQTVFSYPYEYFNDSDLQLTLTDSDGEVSEPLFTISPTNGDKANGADITLEGISASVGDVITISRVVPFTQEYDLQSGSTIDPTALNKAFDRVVAQNQQQEASLKRSLTHPTSDPVDSNGNPTLNYTASSVSDRAGKALGYDTDGNITELDLATTGTLAGNSLQGIDITNNVISTKIDTSDFAFDELGNIKLATTVTNNFDKPIVRWNGTTTVAEDTIALAISNSSAGDTIFLKNGTYTEDITSFNKAGITIIGSSSGEWNGSTYVGGTIIKGKFRWLAAATNCTIKHLGFATNNPTNDTGYNLTFFGGQDDAAVNFNSHLEDIAFYGDGYCTHNTEFRGKNWYCDTLRSYKAGTHNLPIKCSDSVFRNVTVDNVGVANSYGIFFKSHTTSSVDMGNPSNTILDGFQVTMSGSTSQRGIFLSNIDDSASNIVDNLQIRNGSITNTTSTNANCIGIEGRNHNNNIIKILL